MQFYKIKEVASILRVHQQTVYNWHREGKIKFVKIVGRNRVEQDELDRFINTQNTNGEAS